MGVLRLIGKKMMKASGARFTESVHAQNDRKSLERLRITQKRNHLNLEKVLNFWVKFLNFGHKLKNFG